MIVLGIDPGSKESGYVIYDSEQGAVGPKAVVGNFDLLRILKNGTIFNNPHVAIEQPRGMGQTAGNELLDTAIWTGRFYEAAERFDRSFVPRKDVKLHLVGSISAKDKNIRDALIERFGEPGTKKEPGKLYGVTSHMLPALAVAVTVADRLKANNGSGA